MSTTWLIIGAIAELMFSVFMTISGYFFLNTLNISSANPCPRDLTPLKSNVISLNLSRPESNLLASDLEMYSFEKALRTLLSFQTYNHWLPEHIVQKLFQASFPEAVLFFLMYLTIFSFVLILLYILSINCQPFINFIVNHCSV